MIKGIVVTHDGVVTVKEFPNQINDAVRAEVSPDGGLIERVKPRTLPHGFIFFCDKEFLKKKLPENRIATILYQRPIICGNIVIMKETLPPGEIYCIDMTVAEQMIITRIIDEIKIQIKEGKFSK